jgi:hypothetical protein
MRAAALLAAGYAVVLAACGGSGPMASQNPYYPYGAANDPVSTSKCMRRNGVPNFPDPGSTGLAKVVAPDSGSPAFQHAAKVCGGPGGRIRFSAAG